MANYESKSFQRFNSRFLTLQQHSQTIDAALRKQLNRLRYKKDNGKSISENLNFRRGLYPCLDVPSTEYARIINYSRRENSDYCFLELYNLFAYYMKDVLKEMYQLRPKSIAAKSNKTISYSKLTEFTSIDALVDYMIDDIFRELEGLRSTPKLVKHIVGHTKICIPQAESDSAMMYLSIRHLIIHNDSKVDKDFFQKYKNKLNISENGKVPTDFPTFQAALSAVHKYIRAIDTELIRNGFVKSRM